MVSPWAMFSQMDMSSGPNGVINQYVKKVSKGIGEERSRISNTNGSVVDANKLYKNTHKST